jgi:hypothetical protein
MFLYISSFIKRSTSERERKVTREGGGEERREARKKEKKPSDLASAFFLSLHFLSVITADLLSLSVVLC